MNTETEDRVINPTNTHHLVVSPQSSALSIQIADMTIALTSHDAELKIGVSRAVEEFLVDDAKPDASVEAAWGDLRGEVMGEKLFDSGGLWQLYHHDGISLFRFTSSMIGPLPYKVASFTHEFTSGKVSLHRDYFHHDHPVYPLEYPLDELLVMNLLAGGKGVEVHACGVIDLQGQGHLFVGQSGAGKTTMATLWQKVEGATILSDDRIILRNVDNRFWMYGTPWHGEARLACPGRVPLTRIYLLRHGQHNELMPYRGPETVARLLACSFLPFYSPEALEFTLAMLEEIVNTVPCYELRFLPDESVVEFIRRLRIER